MQTLKGETKAEQSESLLRNVRAGMEEQQLEGSVGKEQPNAQSASTGSFSRLQVPIATHRRESTVLETRMNRLMQPMLARRQSVDPGVNALLLIMESIVCNMKFITKRMEEEDEYEDATNDWRFAAMVVDRLCLVIFTAFITGSTCGIMFSSPHLVA